jgi:hypothetical protein
MTELQWKAFREVLRKLFPHEFHHGDCVGADDEAATLVYQHCGATKIVRHPPDNTHNRSNNQCHRESREPNPYLERNRAIVDETMHLIAAVRGPEEVRSGTWSTVRYARKLGRRITIVWPDGKVADEPMDLDKWAESMKGG